MSPVWCLIYQQTAHGWVVVGIKRKSIICLPDCQAQQRWSWWRKELPRSVVWQALWRWLWDRLWMPDRGLYLSRSLRIHSAREPCNRGLRRWLGLRKCSSRCLSTLLSPPDQNHKSNVKLELLRWYAKASYRRCRYAVIFHLLVAVVMQLIVASQCCQCSECDSIREKNLCSRINPHLKVRILRRNKPLVPSW